MAPSVGKKVGRMSIVQAGFPVYAVEYCASSETVFVAGGGGRAKSGVCNSIVASVHRPLTV